MTEISERFYLFVASTEPESATSRLKTSGVEYRRKRLDSTPANWMSICTLLESPNLAGAVVKLTSRACSLLLSDQYSDASVRFLDSLSKSRHILFAHIAILTGDEQHQEEESSLDLPSSDEDDLFGDSWFLRESIFSVPPKEDRQAILNLINEYQINLVPYRRNAELSVLASKFVEEHDKNLLFRVYIPTDQMWATEADKLLKLFGDWVARFKGHRIRQDGYTTPKGTVYEFYSEEHLSSDILNDELQSFSNFLELCVDDPSAAEKLLEKQSSVSHGSAIRIIERYAREARRINLDLRQERQTRLLTVRHRLESELLEEEIGADSAIQFAESLIPQSTQDIQRIVAPGPNAEEASSGNVIIHHQQVIGKVQGIVAQEISGLGTLDKNAVEVLKLISEFGEREKSALESSVHELEDEDAKSADRLAARQKLTSFMIRAGEKIGTAGTSILQKYVESKLGI